jgi:hypothetical protein
MVSICGIKWLDKAGMKLRSVKDVTHCLISLMNIDATSLNRLTIEGINACPSWKSCLKCHMLFFLVVVVVVVVVVLGFELRILHLQDICFAT